MSDPPNAHDAARSGVTVIVVTYQHERFVDGLLQSIAAQSTLPERVILCDDASPDASAERLRGWAATTPLDTVLLLAESNRGLTATLNLALDRVETPYFAYIAGDDLMQAERLGRQLSVFAARPDLAFVYSDAQVIDEEGVEVDPSFVSRHRPARVDDSFDGLLAGNWIPAPSVMVRTRAVREVGGYDEDLFLEDYDLWLRLASRFSFTHVDEALVSWREVATSLGARMFRDEVPTWALARIRILAKHWGRDARTDQVVTDAVRPLLIALAKQGVPARQLAAGFRGVARVDRRATSRAYAVVSATGSTTALRWLANARLPRHGREG